MRRLLALLLLLLVALPAAPAAAQQPPPVVVVGVAGLRWDDVSARTPVLRALAERSAVGALSVKALPAVSCRGDGWLTLGAGARAEQYGGGDDPCDARLPDDPDRQAERNADSRDGAVLGALAAALDGQVALEGDGPRVAAGLAPDGRTGSAGSADGSPGSVGPGGSTTTSARAPLARLVDGGVLTAVDRRGALAGLDQRLGRLLDDLPAGTDLLLVGLSAAAGESQARLHLALATGPSFPRGALVSASTRRAPYVQLVDVAPTVLALLDRPVPEVMDGQPWRVEGEAPAVAELLDADRLAQGQREATVPYFVVAIALLAVGLTVTGARRWHRATEVVALAGVLSLGLSYVANLLPWWRADEPLVALLALVLPMAVVGGALLRRTPCPAGLACAAVAGVLVLDLVTGGRLQLSSVAGYSPLVAGRFAGIGNVAFGVLAGAVLLATALLARRLAAVAAVAVVAVAVDGAPPWGSDVGGVLALLPAFVVLGLVVSGRRVSFVRLALAGLAAAAVVSAFALADLARPAPDRTHLGRFAADVRDGTAGDVLSRKAEAVLALLFRSPVTALLPVVVAAAVYLVLRPPPALQSAFVAVPRLRTGLAAVGVASLLGFLANDSGAAVPAMALLVAAPATIAVAARAARPAGAPAPVG